jgi:hypothetical protein
VRDVKHPTSGMIPHLGGSAAQSSLTVSCRNAPGHGIVFSPVSRLLGRGVWNPRHQEKRLRAQQDFKLVLAHRRQLPKGTGRKSPSVAPAYSGPPWFPASPPYYLTLQTTWMGPCRVCPSMLTNATQPARARRVLPVFCSNSRANDLEVTSIP